MSGIRFTPSPTASSPSLPKPTAPSQSAALQPTAAPAAPAAPVPAPAAAAPPPPPAAAPAAQPTARSREEGTLRHQFNVTAQGLMSKLNQALPGAPALTGGGGGGGERLGIDRGFTAAPAAGVFVPSGAPPVPPTEVDLKPGQEGYIAQVFKKSEIAAKSNTAADTQWTTEEIKKDPKGFTKNLTQLDGNPKTDKDKMSCAPTSILGGALLSNPESVQDLAKKLQTPEGRKEFPSLAKPPASESVARIAAGKYSANDVRVMSNGLHDDMQYPTGKKPPEPTMTTGMPSAREMAMMGKLKKIGWDPPPMDVNCFGDPAHEKGNHVNAYANGTGYDPWPYPGSQGKAKMTDGNAAAMQHGKTIRANYGLDGDYDLLDKKSFDGKGNITWERRAVDGKPINPPLKANYSFDAKQNCWVRDPNAKIPKEYESQMPAKMPLETEQRKKLGGLEVDD